MSIKNKAYEVWYEVDVDNGYEYLTDVRCEGFDNFVDAIQLANRLYEELEVNNIAAKHYGWEFYVPGGKSYVVQMLDSYEQDEMRVAGPIPFVDALQELLKLNWNNNLDWVSYKLEHYVCPAAPVCPPAPDCFAEDDELPF